LHNQNILKTASKEAAATLYVRSFCWQKAANFFFLSLIPKKNSKKKLYETQFFTHFYLVMLSGAAACACAVAWLETKLKQTIN